MKRFFSFTILAITAVVLMACSVTFNLGDPTATAPAPQIAFPTEAFDSPTALPQPTVVVVLPTAEPNAQEITVYFMDENRFIAATEPYEVAVTRTTSSDNLPLAVLEAYFAGPTQQEYDQGLRLLSSGFTHVRNLTIENGIARVYLGGVCANNGAAYSVATPIMNNLEQFPEINAVKIYDENDSNLDPDSPDNSLPYCLEP
jgi:hypothetical protein